MIYFVDIDGTICNTQGNDYENAVPVQENIDKINKLFDAGHTIIYWTARGNTSGRDWQFFTIHQLHKWGVKYNSVKMNKPSYDFFICDRALKISEL